MDVCHSSLSNIPWLINYSCYKPHLLGAVYCEDKKIVDRMRPSYKCSLALLKNFSPFITAKEFCKSAVI